MAIANIEIAFDEESKQLLERIATALEANRSSSPNYHFRPYWSPGPYWSPTFTTSMPQDGYIDEEDV